MPRTGSKKGMDLSLIIPIYNQSSFVEPTTRAYHEAFSKSTLIRSFEIILVSNNCSDDTPVVCAQMVKRFNHVRHYDYPFRTRKGGAVMRGFGHATYSVVGFTDVDMSVSPFEFLKLVPPLSDPLVGAVIASRRMSDSVLLPPQPFSRRVLGAGFAIIREILFGLGVRDSQCGAKLFRRETILPFDTHSMGWAFDVELLLRVKDRGKRIEEIGVVWNDRPGSVLGLFSPFTILVELVSLRLSYRAPKE